MMQQKLERDTNPAKGVEALAVVPEDTSTSFVPADTPQSSLGRILNQKGDDSNSGSPSRSRSNSPVARQRNRNGSKSPTKRDNAATDKDGGFNFDKFNRKQSPKQSPDCSGDYSPVMSPTRSKTDVENQSVTTGATGISGLTVPSLRPEMCVTPSMQAFTEKYEISEALGAGAFGQVSLATCVTTGEKLAAKQVKTDQADIHELFVNEFEIAKRLKHPNIVRVHDMFVNENICYLVMDLCTGGDLVQFVEEHEEYAMGHRMYAPPDENIIAKLLWQMLQSIRYIHHYDIVHRDVKMENFLLARPSDEEPEIKLIDFGLAKRLGKGEVLRDYAGSAGYTAPEVLQGVGYGFPCDAWSVGVCMFMVFTGQFPIPLSKESTHAKDTQEMRRLTDEHEITYKDKGYSIPNERANMLRTLLQKDPSSRSTPKQVLSTDKWLRSVGRGKNVCCCTVA